MFDFESTPAATVDLALPDANGRPPFSFGRRPLNGLNVVTGLNEEQQFPLGETQRRTAKSASRVRLPRDGDDLTPLYQAFGMDVVSEHGYAACPLPGHGSVAWLDSVGGRYGPDLRFWCDCFGADSQFPGDYSTSGYHRHLADAYHAIQTGRPLTSRSRSDDLPLALRGYWSLRLARAIGSLPTVDLPLLPADADDDLHRGRDLFGLLCARELDETGVAEAAFARTLVAASLDISDFRARQVIDGLRDAGVIALVRREPAVGRRRNGVSVFAPGGAALAGS